MSATTTTTTAAEALAVPMGPLLQRDLEALLEALRKADDAAVPPADGAAGGAATVGVPVRRWEVVCERFAAVVQSYTLAKARAGLTARRPAEGGGG